MTTAGEGVAEESRPRCACHDEPMKWQKDARRRGGGYWRCREAQRASDRRYYAENDNALLRRSCRIRMSAGGLQFHVGYAPTPEAALRLRQRIKEEAPT